MTRMWHAAIALLAAVALVGQTVLVIDKDRSLVNLFSYFTIQSNILVLIAAALIALKPDRGGKAFGILRMAGLVGITITGIVYSTILAGNGELRGRRVVERQGLPLRRAGHGGHGFVVVKPRTRLDKSSLWFLVWASRGSLTRSFAPRSSDPRIRGHERTRWLRSRTTSSTSTSTAEVLSAIACVGVMVLALSNYNVLHSGSPAGMMN